MNYGQPSKPEQWIEKYGYLLSRIALSRVTDPEQARDLVQETLLAALQARKRFAERSTEKTWLVGILIHKILDYYRTKQRERQHMSSTQPSRLPDRDGLMIEASDWPSYEGRAEHWSSDAGNLLERKEFWKVLNCSLSTLPPRTAKAFLLREVEELSAEEICRILKITPGNLWVILHRAKKHLRHCLEQPREGVSPLVA